MAARAPPTQTQALKITLAAGRIAALGQLPPTTPEGEKR
jgi:hypothetical protein